MTTLFVIAFVRCGAELCGVFYPMPGHHYSHLESCRRDAGAFTAPPGSEVVCMSVPAKMVAKR